jgi:L-amino acid N-acyltransferase YncA
MHHRIAILEDLPRIVEIYNSTVASRMVTADLEPVSVASREAWFHEHRGDFRPLWVAEEDGVRGWLSFSRFYPRAAYDKTAEISVYVDAARRQSGVASYLLSAAIEHAPRIKVDTLIGFIFSHNEPSRALFAKCGFQQWGYLPKVTALDAIERDVVIVGRRLA